MKIIGLYVFYRKKYILSCLNRCLYTCFMQRNAIFNMNFDALCVFYAKIMFRKPELEPRTPKDSFSHGLHFSILMMTTNLKILHKGLWQVPPPFGDEGGSRTNPGFVRVFSLKILILTSKFLFCRSFYLVKA